MCISIIINLFPLVAQSYARRMGSSCTFNLFRNLIVSTKPKSIKLYAYEYWFDTEWVIFTGRFSQTAAAAPNGWTSMIAFVVFSCHLKLLHVFSCCTSCVSLCSCHYSQAFLFPGIFRKVYRSHRRGRCKFLGCTIYQLINPSL